MTIEKLAKANELSEYINAIQNHLKAWQGATEIKEIRFLEGAKNHIAVLKCIDFDKLKDNAIANILIDLEKCTNEFKAL